MNLIEATESGVKVTTAQVVRELKAHNQHDIIVDGDWIIVNNGHQHDEACFKGQCGEFEAAEILGWLGY